MVDCKPPSCHQLFWNSSEYNICVLEFGYSIFLCQFIFLEPIASEEALSTQYLAGRTLLAS